MITVLAGGVGAARYLSGLVASPEGSDVTAVVNVADDFVLHGLHISPDLDTVTYTLAGEVNPETGWGRRDETWSTMRELESFGGPAWFNLGDRDLGLHLFRTGALQSGSSLSEVTEAVTARWDVPCRIVPVSDDPIRTVVTLTDGTEIGFQDYFVRRAHDVAISAVRFDGIAAAEPAPGVLDAIAAAEVVVIAPSNPVVSIGPVLAVPGVTETLARRRQSVVAVSPIVGGRALKGPASRMLRELGEEPSVEAVATRYRDVAATLVIDTADAERVDKVTAAGMVPVVTDTVMSAPPVARALAVTSVAAGRRS